MTWNYSLLKLLLLISTDNWQLTKFQCLELIDKQETIKNQKPLIDVFLDDQTSDSF